MIQNVLVANCPSGEVSGLNWQSGKTSIMTDAIHMAGLSFQKSQEQNTINGHLSLESQEFSGHFQCHFYQTQGSLE